jgi:signal transduction histidine kinase/ActR/RegA family two-component response regulator
MSQASSRPSETSQSELERALAYYRGEYNELGGHLLRLQEEQSRAFREARRSRTVAKLIRETHRLADTGIPLDELGARILEIVVENVVCDRAALLVAEPAGSAVFAVAHAIGFGTRAPASVTIEDPPPFVFTSAQVEPGPAGRQIAALLGVPFVLWAHDEESGRALVIGNASEVNVNRAFDAGDREVIEGGLSVYLDVFARKRAEVQLRDAKEAADALRLEAERATQAKSLFLAAMSHEIRTPMTAVLGMADLLAHEALDQRQRGYVDAIRTSGTHLLAIINDILDFSRLEAGRLELESVDFQLARLCVEVLGLFEREAEQRGLTLTLDLEAGAKSIVRGDATRLRQILINLLDNGLKFTSSGGVAVRVRRLTDAGVAAPVRFEVHDSGIGIPLERQQDLFQPFGQLHPAQRGVDGTGLGLAICRRLVGAFGGTMGVESRPDVGSLFWFEIPLPPGEARAEAEPQLGVPAAARSLRVLVAEDAPLTRDLLGAMLAKSIASVEFAADGEEAFRLVRARQFDLVLMDVQMPVVDGVEATRRIRQLPPPAGTVPIIGLTANVLEEDRRRYLASGMDKVLLKPIVWEDFFEVLAKTAAGTVERSRS